MTRDLTRDGKVIASSSNPEALEAARRLLGTVEIPKSTVRIRETEEEFYWEGRREGLKIAENMVSRASRASCAPYWARDVLRLVLEEIQTLRDAI